MWTVGQRSVGARRGCATFGRPALMKALEFLPDRSFVIVIGVVQTVENVSLRRSGWVSGCGSSRGRNVGKSRGLWATHLSPHAVHRRGVLHPHLRALRPQLSTARCTTVHTWRGWAVRSRPSGPQHDVGNSVVSPAPGGDVDGVVAVDAWVSNDVLPTGVLWIAVDISAHTLCTRARTRSKNSPDLGRRGEQRAWSTRSRRGPSSVRGRASRQPRADVMWDGTWSVRARSRDAHGAGGGRGRRTPAGRGRGAGGTGCGRAATVADSGRADGQPRCCCLIRLVSSVTWL